MVVDQNFFIWERPFFAKQNYFRGFATSMSIFHGTHAVMLSNNSSYEDSFITCKITPNYHGQLLQNLANLQLA